MEQNGFASAPQSDSFSDAINGILSNPEMLSMISSMASKLKNGTQEDSSATNNPAQEPTAVEAAAIEDTKGKPVTSVATLSKLPDMIGAIAPLLSSELSKHPKKDDKRACLLRALKPYLSEGRSEAIDYIIKFSEISDLLKNLS